MDSKGNEIGRIIKHWSGIREIFGGVNDFRIQCKFLNPESSSLLCVKYYSQGIYATFEICLTIKMPNTTIVVCFVFCRVTLKIIVVNSVDLDQTVRVDLLLHYSFVKH